MMEIATKTDTLDIIQQQIAENPLILYMKGTPEQPRCGFSHQAVQVLKACGLKFAYIDILENPGIRQALPEYSGWPTFPQLFYKKELIGGCDILLQLYKSGELQKKIIET